MASAKGLRIRKPFLGILNRNRSLEMFGKSKKMKCVDRQVPPEVITRDHQTAYDLREIETFPEAHLLESFHTRKSATYFTYR